MNNDELDNGGPILRSDQGNRPGILALDRISDGSEVGIDVGEGESLDGIDQQAKLSYVPVAEEGQQKAYTGNNFIGKKSKKRIIIAGGIICVMMVATVGLTLGGFFRTKEEPIRPVSNISSEELSQLSEKGVQDANQVTINGALQLNSQFVVTPSARPQNAEAGQIYYDKESNKFLYYDGRQYQGITNDQSVDQLTMQLQELRNQLTDTSRSNPGNGLQLVGGVMNNTGVLSLQGATGDVALRAGAGINLQGLTITNTGVTSLTGTANQVGVSAANGAITLSLPQNISVASSPSFAGMTLASALGVSSGGTGASSYTNGGVIYFNGTSFASTGAPASSGLCLVSTPSGPAFGSCSGAPTTGIAGSGTPGRLSYFDTANSITDSLLQQSGANVSLTGSGTFSATNLQGNGAAITALNAGNISTGTLSVARGGTGASSFIADRVILGDGTNALKVSNAPVAGYCFMGNASGAPTFQACPVGGNISSGSSQTAGRITKFDTTTNTITDSIMSELSNVVSVAGTLNATNLSGAGSGITALNASNLATGTVNDGLLTANVTLQGNTFNGSQQLLRLDSGGQAVSNGLCLMSTGGGTGTAFQACPGSGPAGANINLSNLSSVAINTTLLPGVTNTIDLGSISRSFRDIYLGGNGVNALQLTSSALTQSRTVTFPDATGIVCLSSGNCVGSSGGGVVSTGGNGYIALFNDNTGYSLASSLLQQSAGAISMTGTFTATNLAGNGSAITALNAGNIATGTLGVARGGTGAASFTANHVILGDGTNALKVSNAPTAGYCFMGNVSGAPTFQACPVGGNISSGGSQTAGRITKFDAATNTITDSIMTETSGTVSVNGVLSATTLTGAGSGITALNASNLTTGTVNDGLLSGNVTLQGNTFNVNQGLLQLDANGQAASNGLCLMSTNNGAGTAFQACPGSGGIGVGSITAGDASIAIGGTAGDPTIAVNVQSNMGLATTGSGLGLQACTSGQILKYNGSAWACASDEEGSVGGDILQNGNSFSQAMTIGTNDNYALNLETAGATKMTILANGNVGIGEVAPLAKLHVNGGSVMVQGTFGGGSGITTTGAGTRMFFDTNKAAFRAGDVTGNQWNDASVGAYSVAMGGDTTASGMYSTALGYGTTASGHYSTALGFNATAQAFASTVVGRYNLIQGNASGWTATDPLFVVGNGTDASNRSNALTVLKNGNMLVGGSEIQKTGSSFDLNILDAGDSTLRITNSGAGVANLNIHEGSLQTNGTTRITNSGTLQNVTLDTSGGSTNVKTSSTSAGVLLTDSSGNISVGTTGSSGLCLMSNSAGSSPSFQACPGGSTGNLVTYDNTSKAGSLLWKPQSNGYGEYSVNIAAGTGYTSIAGDYLEYDVWCDSGSYCNPGVINVGTGTNGQLGVDQNGIANGSPTVNSLADISAYATGRWYHRKIALTPGTSMNNVYLIWAIPTAGTTSLYFKNIDITNGSTIRNRIYTSGQPSGNFALGQINGGSRLCYMSCGGTNNGLEELRWDYVSSLDVAGLSAFRDKVTVGCGNGIQCTNNSGYGGGASQTSATYLVQKTATLGVYGTIAATGTITASTTPDIAETIDAAEDVEAGDLVVPDPNHPERAIKSTKAYDSSTLGAISDGTGGFLINAYGDKREGTYENGLTGKPLVLAGRIKVKVSGENGAIRIGDPITTSNTPGYGMKATRAGSVVGYALDNFEGELGEVLVYLNLSYYAPEVSEVLQPQDFTGLNVSDTATIGSLTVTGTATFKGNIVLEGHLVTSGGAATAQPESAAGNGATVTLDGNDTAGTITITTGSNGITHGELATVTFNKAYAKVPKIVLSGQDDASLAARIFPAGKSLSTFKLKTEQMLVPNTTYTFDYVIVE